MTNRAHLISTVSHAVRSPLTSIIAIGELASKKPEILENLDLIFKLKEEAQSCLNTIDNLLFLLRAESIGNSCFEYINIQDSVHAAISASSMKAKEKGIKIKFENPMIAYVLGEATLLEQLFSIVIDNAISYSDKHSTVIINYDRQQDRVGISVRDSGKGIEPTDILELFTKVEKTFSPDNGKEHVRGLGLNCIKAIVDVHGGEINVTSELGKGTEFSISLPLARHICDSTPKAGNEKI